MFQTTITQSKSNASITAVSIPTATETVRLINVSDCISDITANIIHDSEHFQLPSGIFEDLVFQALNDLVDDFSDNPEKYLKPRHETEIDCIAYDYLHH